MVGVNRVMMQNRLYPAGYGYVIIPDRVNRDEYIQTCYRKGTVSIISYEGGNFMKDCLISISALKEVIFPESVEKLGSVCCYVTEPFSNKPAVVAVLFKGGEGSLSDEGKFDLSKQYGGNNVGISGSAKDGTLNINVNDFEEEGILNINVTGGAGSKVNISCQTEAKIKSDEKVTLESFGELDLRAYNVETKKETKITITKEGDVSVEGENISLLSGTDFAVRYSALATAYNQLKSDFNSLVKTFNTHIHATTATVSATTVPGVISPTTTPGVASSGDITPAKVEEIKVP